MKVAHRAPNSNPPSIVSKGSSSTFNVTFIAFVFFIIFVTYTVSVTFVPFVVFILVFVLVFATVVAVLSSNHVCRSRQQSTQLHLRVFFTFCYFRSVLIYSYSLHSG